jgi:hypothetical protein
MNCSQPDAKGTDPCCPDCGALECLCRPRFFAGQLLSEQDLNRLDRYIKNKNRLHNRHQHGWGVVNGLLVLCDPCGGVKVTQGYAVDPCGDDIVICEETRVDICELIQKCKQAEQQNECQPFHQPPNANCSDLEEEWVLTIKYQEWPSRGVTALRGNSCGTTGCSTGCNCGAASAVTTACSCGENGSNASSQGGANVSAKKNRAAPPQCEPTVICEGYVFGVYKKPEQSDDDDDDRLFQLEGSFWDAVRCCAEPLVNAIPPMPDPGSDDDLMAIALAYSSWCCQFRQNLLDYFMTHRHVSCEIIEHLRAVNCPNVNSPGSFVYDAMVALLELLAAWMEGAKNCMCLALLPPTPQATCDVRVPLATVRIRARDCHVLSICNWTQERKIMVTWPAMAHWLGIVPIGDLIRELLERMCCSSLLDIFDNVMDNLPQGIGTTDHIAHAAAAPRTVRAPAPGAAPAAGPEAASATEEMSAAAATAGTENIRANLGFSQTLHMASGAMASRFSADLGSKMNSFSSLLDNIVQRGDAPLELGAVLNSVSPRFKLPDNSQALSKVEAKNLPLLMASKIMVKPVLSSFMGSSKAAQRVAEYQQDLVKSGAKSKAKKAADSADDSTVSSADLKRQVDDMREQLKKQEAQIKSLKSKMDK